MEEILNSFLSDVKEKSLLEERWRTNTALAVILATSTPDLFFSVVDEKEVDKEETLEIILQGIPYLGYGIVYPFLKELKEKYPEIKVESRKNDRLKEGVQAQVDIFGPGMKNFYCSGDEYTKNINYYLASNCFGDYYTRGIFTLKEREVLTFSYLYALGFVLPQLKAHIKANLALGNDKDFLLSIIENNIVYVGYPKSLNAINALKEVNNAL